MVAGVREREPKAAQSRMSRKTEYCGGTKEVNFTVILTGGKEISAHLRRGIRTAQRWERQGLPVRRVTRSSRAPVVADSEELDAWTLRNAATGAGRSPELRATIQRARDLRVEAQRARDALHVTMSALRKQLDSLEDK